MALPWRRVRFLIYLAIAALIYQCLTSLRPRTSTLSPLAPQEDENVAIDSSNTSDDKMPSLDLPWYRSPHRRPNSQNDKYATIHLSTNERMTLQEQSVKRAQEVAEAVLGPVKEIRGSQVADVDSLRSKINCWTSGHWIPGKGYHVPKHFQDPLYGKCRSQDRLNYHWQIQEDQCPPMQYVDPNRWCHALNGRHVLLVGDLVQYQLHDVLLDAMRDGPTVCFGELNYHTLCAQPEARMRYLRNDVLSTIRRIDKAGGHPSVDIVQWPFTTKTMLKAYSVLILNRAPVVEDDETFIQEMVKTMHTIRQASPDMLIIYRSTSIGHPYCNDASSPLNRPLTDDELVKLPYGWSELQRRNAMAREIVEAAGGIFVDLAALTDLRPDGHVGGQDCLRYCIPGPLDTWAQVLYNVLLELEG
ncbi:hypothetical protein BDC45DRAFT_566272 [Circinella umbellata]|nr:hypothetical protein BDC45DRAFT_566272 [Circinella umbellata]